MALPHGGGRHQLGQTKDDQPDRDQAAVVEQRREVAADQGNEAVAGVLAPLLGRQRAKVACGSKLGTASRMPTMISLRPRTAL
jgi:hypothetical protein